MKRTFFWLGTVFLSASMACGLTSSAEAAAKDGSNVWVLHGKDESGAQAGNAAGQDWNEMNVPSFAADMVLTGAQGQFSARFYTTSGKSRMEMTGSTSIVRLDRSAVYVLMDAEKTYIEQLVNPEMSAQAMTGDAAIVSRKELGKEKVEGKDAVKYEVVLASNGNKQTVYQWMVHGVPVPAKMQAVDGSWTVEYRNVQAGPQPEGLFEIPAGYKRMDMPALPQDISQLAAFQKAGEQKLKKE